MPVKRGMPWKHHSVSCSTAFTVLFTSCPTPRTVLAQPDTATAQASKDASNTILDIRIDEFPSDRTKNNRNKGFTVKFALSRMDLSLTRSTVRTATT